MFPTRPMSMKIQIVSFVKSQSKDTAMSNLPAAIPRETISCAPPGTSMKAIRTVITPPAIRMIPCATSVQITASRPPITV
ncbi:MAG: hypothetical protein BWY06_00714 [Candidatus Latescibacteria bacterium ADurb.Bin168]|nr:MAG: hypothetical protein BWY06_00714 [Candidatus Latescibacteria bacterium ADurb.Bin168]